ncbi:MAG: exosortase C-terminal domain/associated protein EpsI [Bryobacteraceae bacterium]|jgi:EpsI family protein
MSFPSNRPVGVLTVVLLLQATAFYAVASRGERAPVVSPLALFPRAFGGWAMARDMPTEKEVQEILRADDTLNRVYVNPSRSGYAFLFIAYFKTQRYGQAPHSPKNCLPGSGWEPVETGRQTIRVSGWDVPIAINRYVVEHGDDKSVVLYWYQSHRRIIASEYWAKFWLVVDSIRYRRSDTSLVKIVAPVRDNNIDAATAMGIQLIQAVFPFLLRQWPT